LSATAAGVAAFTAGPVLYVYGAQQQPSALKREDLSYTEQGNLDFRISQLMQRGMTLTNAEQTALDEMDFNRDSSKVYGSPERPKDKALGDIRKTVPNQSGKQASTDIPSWAEGTGPRGKEEGKKYAERLMNNKYGFGNWGKVQARMTEYSQLKKYGDRNFERHKKK
jgi:hypothetical protein